MPIVRLMLYPLFLDTICSLTVPESAEYQQLTEAKVGMEHMADYINEMQRINDQFGVLFQQLFAECAFTELWLSASVNTLCHNMDVMWLNANQSLMHGHSWKKGIGPKVRCFVFKTVVIILAEQINSKRKSTKNLADVPAPQQISCTMDDLRFWTVVRTSRAKVVDLPDSDGVTGMWQLVNKTTQPATTYLFRNQEGDDKQSTLTMLRQVIRDRSAALTALTPGTARRCAAACASAAGQTADANSTGQFCITSYSRLHQATLSTCVVSPDADETSVVFTCSAQLSTGNRRRRALGCGRTAEAAASAALGTSENYFVSEEIDC